MRCTRCEAALPAASRFCPACGLPRAGTIAMQAERRLVTVLFADISGFTALAEQLDPEDVRETINAYLRELVSVVHAHGGTVDKFIGDAVMALFGAPQAHEDDAERALAAALAMREALAAVAAGFTSHLPAPLSLHIGINTGLVVAGAVGSSAHSQYTVLGDAVNIAARLEDLSTDGQILVAESTRRLTAHAFSFTSLPPSPLKGKAAPVAVFALRGRRAAPRPSRGIATLHTPFLGREREMTVLTRALDALIAGSGGRLSIEGPAGAGKSRLLHELRALAEQRGIAWVQAEVSNLDQGQPLLIWSVAVRRLLAGAGNQTRVIQTARPGQTEIAPLHRDAVGTLLHSLGIAPLPERGPVTAATSAAKRPQLIRAVLDLVSARASAQPLVLAFEDLHWADADSLDLIEAVSELTSHLPILVVITRRGEHGAATDATIASDQSDWLRLILAPLDDEASRRLAGVIVGDEGASGPVAVMLAGHADGNPLYLEETFRALVDQGILQHSPDGAWLPATATTDVVLPPTLHGLLLGRIDHLSAPTKHVLHLAAVAGRSFPPALIQRLAGDMASAQHLATLVRLGFLEPALEGPSLRFRHALLHEAAYSSLLRRRRRDYHRQVAEAMVAAPDLWPDGADQPAALARHWQRAEEWPESARWSLRAAEAAGRAGAHAEAKRLYAEALVAAERTGDGGAIRAVCVALAGWSLTTGAPGEALTALDRAAALPSSSAERALLMRLRGDALAGLGDKVNAMGAYHEALAALGPVQISEGRTTRAERARCAAALGRFAWQAGRLTESRDLMSDAARHADNTEDRTLVAQIGVHLARVLTHLGDLRAAEAALERSADDEVHAWRVLLGLGGGTLTPAEALLKLISAAEIDPLGFPARLALATLARRLGKLDEARIQLRAVLSADPVRQGEPALTALCHLTLVAVAAGQAPAAVAVAGDALARAQASGHQPLSWFAGRMSGLALTRAGRHVEADEALRAVVEATRAAGARWERAAALGVWAAVREALGDPAGAEALRAERQQLTATPATGETEDQAPCQPAP